MINIWVFIGVCIIFISIMIREFLRGRKLENDYLNLESNHSNIKNDYSNLKIEHDGTLIILGYYRLRFGEVTIEDIMNKIGINVDKLET